MAQEDSGEEENVFIEKEGVEKTKFQSPIPILRQIRNLIFGTQIPDMYTQITFFMNIILWSTFIIWDVLGYITLTSTDLFIRQKGLPIDEIIAERGTALGFADGEFLSRLTTFHAIGIICWVIYFIGLILMYRKIRTYRYLCLGSMMFYLGMCILYISFTYFLEDTTAYDKIALLIMAVSIMVHSYLMGNRISGTRTGFFGELIEEDE